MGRKVNERGLALIKSFEGCSLHAYPDPGTGGEPITIGYGHTGGVKRDATITQAEADALLASDLARFESGVDALLGEATGNQFSACVCLAFNIGLSHFAGSTVLKRHRQGNFTAAANAFLLWRYAAGKPLRGLERRREAERKLYLGEA